MKHLLHSFLLFYCLSIVLFSCKQAQEENQSTPKTTLVKADVYLPKTMVGAWYSKQLNITLDALSDSAKVMEINVADFPEKLHISNVRAEYLANGHFTSAYIDTLGKVIQEELGTWYAKNDSLFVKYSPNGKEQTYVYWFEATDTAGLFKSLMDWDNDGLTDDYIELHSEKIKD